jgi:murein DD-endopeptidase MepM/ murein hydrolase activator NlpD
MTTPQKEKQSWFRRWRNKYRLVVMHDKTFEVETSVKLSAWNMVVIASTLFVVIAFLVYLLIILTPLKSYVSGYSEVNTTRQLLKNSATVDSILQELHASEVYYENMIRTLKGEVDTIMPDSSGFGGDYSSIVLDTVSELDRAIREQVENEDLFSLAAVDPETTGQENFRSLHFFPPVKGTVTSSFDPDEDHYGTDIVARENTPIKACYDGTVIESYWNIESGNVVVIQHQYGLISIYKHNSQVLKKRGTFVRAGDVIAIIGNTGELSTGPHLHFELWHNRVPIDPEGLIIFN